MDLGACDHGHKYTIAEGLTLNHMMNYDVLSAGDVT